MRTVALAATFFLTAGLALAQGRAIPASTLAKPPTVDGTIDESEWAGAARFEGLVDASTGGAAPETGVFWLAFDQDYIYFAASLADSQPGAIAATEHRTNVGLSGDDYVRLDIDLSGSLADFNSFTINPAGATDISLAGGRAAKREWSGEFLAQSKITERGWETEARIPWQVMRLPGAGQREVRFNVIRRMQRTQRVYQWSYTNNGGQNQNSGRWTDVVLPKPYVDHSINLLPYTYLGWSKEDHTIFNSGVDVKTQLTEEIPAVLSVNPDFRNIENQILSIDFSRFERLAGETRPFFQEGATYFGSALFASQRIRSFDAGLNIHGKLSDKLSFGVLDTVDFGNQNNLVTNFTYDPSPRDSYRITATHHAKSGDDNSAWLLRYSRTQGNFNLFLRTMGTKGTESNGTWNSASVSYFQGSHQAYVGYDAVSPNFIPALGFAPERDLKGLTLAYGFQKPIPKGTVAEWSFSLNGVDFQKFDGGHYRNQINPDVALVLRDGTSVDLMADWEDFLGSKDHLYTLSLSRPRGNPYNNWRGSYSTGRVEGEAYRSFAIGRAFRPIKDFQITANYQAVDHGDHFDQAIVGLNYDIGHDQSFSGRVVKQRDAWNAYLAYRRSGNRGIEYFLILGDPNADRFKWSLILKAVFPIRIK